MIKIYNSNYEFLKLLDSCKDIYTTETLSTGLMTLCFKVPCLAEMFKYIQEENYVETQNYSFIIKEQVLNDNDFIEVHCVANVEELTGRIFPYFDVFEQNLENAYLYCLSLSSGWTLEYNSLDMTMVTYQVPNVNAFEMIERIAQDHGQEYWFDTKNKIVKIYTRKGKDFGAYYSNELKLKQLAKQSSSYDYATVLYPYGKDGLTIRTINDDKIYLENFSYSNKFIEKIFIDEDIDVPEKLKQKAEEYLEEISMPRASYKLFLSDLKDNIEVGDNIVLVDKIKQIKQKQRVVKIIRYLREPERSSVEISNLQADFARDFVRGQLEMKKEIQYLKNLYKNL